MKTITRLSLVIGLTALNAACSDGAGFNQRIGQQPPIPPQAEAVVRGDTKQLVFSWSAVDHAIQYRLMENADGHSGFAQVGDNIPANTLSVSHDISVHAFDWANAQYVVEACNVSGCSASEVITVSSVVLDAIGYFKASNTDSDDWFGGVVSMSDSGDTIAVAASGEDSSTTGVNGDQSDNTAADSGAVYVFRFNGAIWHQQANLKASNTDSLDYFGWSIDLSANGNTLAVGAIGEASAATGINGDQSDNSAPNAGAVYLYRFDATGWIEQAYIKASNTDVGDTFGGAVALSADGDSLAVGAYGEASSATSINGEQNDQLAPFAGAAYVFRFDGGVWQQQAYIKASNAEFGDFFGWSADLSADGNTLAVGALLESSNATGVGGDQHNNSSFASGAVYLYQFDGVEWTQQAYIKASNADTEDAFGGAIALSADGDALAATAWFEDSVATGVNGDQTDNSATDAGAVYLFRFDGSDWSQAAYIKSSNTDNGDWFGWSTALSGDGGALVVGAVGEASGAAGINGDQGDNSTHSAGAAYLFRFDGFEWIQRSYVKASNADVQDEFGGSVALSADGESLAIGAYGEAGSASGINPGQHDNLAEASGVVYVY